MKKKISKKKKIVLIVLLAILIPYLTAVHIRLVEYGYYDVFFAKMFAGKSRELRDRAKELGVKDLTNVYFYSMNQAEVSRLYNKTHKKQAGEQMGAFVLYNAKCEQNCKYSIFINNDEQDQEDIDAFIAHEYMHTRYHEDNLANDAFLSKELYELTQSNIWLGGTINNLYSIPNDPDEALAYACTDMTDEHITSYIKDTCNKYIDRSKLKLTK